MKPLRIGHFCVAAVALAAGCKSGPAPEPETLRQGPWAKQPGITGPAPAMPAETQKGDTLSPTMSSVHIDERIVRTCGNLPEPHFELDSAAIRDQAAETLRTVARCFADGPLRGMGVKLVGRADPRGTETYNLALGHDRAASVARFLEGAGIPRASIRVTSRGEMEASGTDERGWALDRRVDIEIDE
jgi:peptidoglycan-associated lipoprotein